MLELPAEDAGASLVVSFTTESSTFDVCSAIGRSPLEVANGRAACALTVSVREEASVEAVARAVPEPFPGAVASAFGELSIKLCESDSGSELSDSDDTEPASVTEEPSSSLSPSVRSIPGFGSC